MTSAGASRSTAAPCHDALHHSSSHELNPNGNYDDAVSHESRSPDKQLAETQTASECINIASSPLRSHALSSSQPSAQQGVSTSSPRTCTDPSATPIPTSSAAHGRETQPANTGPSPPENLEHKNSSANMVDLSRTPSLKAAFANLSGSIGTSGSTMSSPVITAMGDMTPLPSPLLSSDSPGPWKRLSVGSASPPQVKDRLGRRGQATVVATAEHNARPAETDGVVANPARRKRYGSIAADSRLMASRLPRDAAAAATQAHDQRDRSVSEYVPDMPSHPNPRNVVVSGSRVNNKLAAETQESLMKREMNFAASRGITPTLAQPPTPPASESSKDAGDGPRGGEGGEWFEACGRHDQKRRRWRSICFLGQGTFSRVMLASSQKVAAGQSPEQPIDVADVKHRRKLVAVKICEHGPRGGASEERIEMSLKRELEIMQDIHHPSLVNLKAWSIEPTRAILVLSYCPGGDLFDIATTHRNLVTPGLLRRIFAEIVGAVKYLHEKNIVHRDIKLENVLVDLTPAELADPSVDWTRFPTSVITLADLGLSRRVADDEKLETRCGSDDYAAPEVIMGQPYDGRATDAWSLGVLLYALLESRLPFDPHPGMSDAHRMRSRTSHRIARVEWRWVGFAGEDGDHEASEARFEEQGLAGAMEITEGLLKRARARWTVDEVASRPWVREAVQVEGGIRLRDEDEGQEV